MTTSTLRPRPGPVLLLLAAAATALAAMLDLRVPGAHRAAVGIEPGWTGGLPGLALAGAGAVVLAQDRRHPLGWVLGVFGVWWAVDGLAASWLTYATLSEPPLAGASVSFWVYQRLGAGLLLVLPLVLVLYPDGRLPVGRWRALALVGLVATSLLPLTLVAAPADVAQPASGAGALPAAFGPLDLDMVTLPLPDAAWSVLLRVSYLALALSLLAPFAVVVREYRLATGLRRTRMRWLLWAAVVDVLLMLTIRLLPGNVGSVGLVVAVVVTAGSVAVGITRPDLVDVDRLLGGTLLYGALLVAAFVLDLLILGAAGRLLGGRLSDDQALVLAVFLVTAVYAPLRHRVWRAVRRWVLGERDDPYRVVAVLAERLEDSPASDVQLLEVARAVAQAFRAPYVGVEIRQVGGELLVAEHGDRPADTRALPIAYRGERIGRLLLPRDGGRGSRLSASDERLLADVVRQAAAATRAGQLAAELQRSRERMVAAVEDERRRLRRDLHDGLGPTLAAVASRIDTARITAARSPEESDRMLALAREEVGGMLTELRRLVHGLRPPALDDVGLVRAIGQQTERLRAPGLTVRVEAPDDLGALPAAVEVAAYRIVSEALTNVVRHARATHCTVRIARDPARPCLVVEVLDDGVGIAPGTSAGVGLVSLRERAAELGGRCEVTAGDPTGTKVHAELPLAPTLTEPALTGAGTEGGLA